ncbi:MAG: CZB domain-containing protein, partial [Dehalococcoidia bacterium]|nr:CZB domain-containing protein [Dehalococcoidia bacterium]
MGKKIMIGIGSALIMLVIVGVWGTVGIDGIVNDGLEVADGNSLRGELLQREVDHLNWAGSVSAFLNDENVTELGVQLDHTKCGFGKWFYGDGRTEAEALLPGLKTSLRDIEEPHKQLHKSAVKIKNVMRKADPALPAFLTKKEVDHLAWTEKVANAILGHEKEVGVQLDHTKCSFGRFLYGDAGAKMSGSDPVLAGLLREVDGPHRDLHQTARQINKSLGAGDADTATLIYQGETLSALEEVRKGLTKMQRRAQENLQGMKEAQIVYAEETQTSLAAVQKLLGKMSAMAKDNILSIDQMVSKAVQTRMGVIITSVLAVVLGIALALIITRSITRPINEVIEGVTEGAEQVSSASSQISSSSQALAEGATEQAASLEETSASLEEMSSTVRQNADNASQAQQLSTVAKETAEKGASSVNKMIKAVNEINSSSVEVSKIIKVIDEIAFQTNLLALNAA